MAFTYNFGGTDNNRNATTYYPNNYVQTNGYSFPNGNVDRDGTRRVLIESLTATYAVGASGLYYRLVFGSTLIAPGQQVVNGLNAQFGFRIGYSSGSLTFGRDDNSGGTVIDAGGGSWSGRLTGSFTWSTVGTAPSSLTPSISGTSVALSWGNSSSNGGNAADGYSVQYSKNGGAWTGTQNLGAVNSYTYTGLEKGAKYKFRVYLRNGVGNSAARESAQITIPYDAPVATSTPTIVRVSDTSQTVSWNRNASPTAPYTSQQLQRREWSNGAWGAWVGVNTVSVEYQTTGSNSVTNATVANRAYQYRVKAINGTGESYSGVSATVLTTPAAPTSFVAEKQTSGAINLTLTQGVSHNSYKTNIEYSLDGGTTWTALVTLNSGVLTYSWSTPPSGSAVVLRARVINDSAGSPGNSLTSGWTQSNSVALTAPPNAPSNLSPNGVTFNAAAARQFSWKHNPVDSSVQAAYEIQYRIVGAPGWTTTGKITSSTQNRTFAANTFVNGNNYEWQARTWGAHANPSPWSATATFIASAPPSVTITSPISGSPWEAAKVLLEWSFTDPEGTAQSMWEAQLLDSNGQTLESRSNSGSEHSVLFSTTLTDDTEYQIQVRGRDGASLWSEWDQVTFTTSFPTPVPPVITFYSWDPNTGAATFSVDNPDGDPEVISNDLLRSLDDGQTWELIGTIPVDGEGADTTIPLGQDVLYKVIAWTDLPSSSESEIVTVNSNYDSEGTYIGPVGGYWSAGPGFVQVVRMSKGQGKPPKMDLRTALAQKTLHYFAGRTKPVETVGEATSRQGNVEFIVSTVTEMQRARAMALVPAPHLIRLPDGTVLFGSISAVEDNRLAEGWYSIQFDITEVDQ